MAQNVRALATVAGLLLATGWSPAAAQVGGCTAIGALHVYHSDHFDVLMPHGVLVRAPGQRAASFYLDFGTASPATRLDYDHRSGFVRVENGLMIGEGLDWKIYPDTPACVRLAEQSGAQRRLRATSPNDPRFLPDNSIEVEGR